MVKAMVKVIKAIKVMAKAMKVMLKAIIKVIVEGIALTQFQAGQF